MIRPDDPTLVAERQAKLDALGPLPSWWRPFARRKWKRSRASILAIDVSVYAAMLRSFYTREYAEAEARRPLSFASILKEPYAADRPFEDVRVYIPPTIVNCTFQRCHAAARPIIDRDPGDES
jgi:hypothetical protein